MPKINILSQHMVNKIAAGEVVERPASVVKELMENSLDAGARKVTVEIEDGGRKLIRISDDGCGMDAEDIELAVYPHATSKIASDDDLFAISTLGFRGEAMASIASVSQMTIASRPKDAIEGWLLEVDGGEKTGPTPTATAPGTVITIRNLFFNTPARRKFMRTANTEIGHITEYFNRIALAHTDIQFTLIHNNRKLRELPADQSLRQRIGMMFSKDLAEELIPINRQDRGIEIGGMIAPPQQSRNGSKWQYVFLNGRFIRDKFIGHAIKEAYRGTLEVNRQPVAFLFVTIDPSTVDVNVHPTKIEVRFADSNIIHSQVLAVIRDKLLGSDLSIRLNSETIQKSAENGNANTPGGEDPEERKKRIRSAMADFFKNKPPSEQSGQHRTPSAYSPPPTSEVPGQYQQPHLPADVETDRNSSVHGGGTLLEQAPANEPPQLAFTDGPAQNDSSQQEPPADKDPDLAPSNFQGNFIQIHNAFIVVQSDEGMAIIDQHALHERILYEKLNRQLNDGPIPSQRFLIPDVVDVTPRQMAIVESEGETLSHLGVILEQFGPGTVAVQGVPTLLGRFEKNKPTAFVSDLLDLMTDQANRVTREELMHSVMDMMACKAAVKAGDPLKPDEIQALLNQRYLINRGDNCPHGRPTTIRMTLAELEKLFKRT